MTLMQRMRTHGGGQQVQHYINRDAQQKQKTKKYLEEAKGPSVLELTISCALQDHRHLIQPESGKKVVYIQVARSCLL